MRSGLYKLLQARASGTISSTGASWFRRAEKTQVSSRELARTCEVACDLRIGVLHARLKANIGGVSRRIIVSARTLKRGSMLVRVSCDGCCSYVA